MRILILAALAALSGCVPGFTDDFAGEWVSDKTGAKVEITRTGDCSYYPDARINAGIKCDVERIRKNESHLVIERNGTFIKAKMVKAGSTLILSMPGSLSDMLDLQ